MSEASSVPRMMKAAAIDGFGGPEMIKLRDLPVPELGPGEVLIKVLTAGIGVWDQMERSGQMAALAPDPAKRFPRVLGADGAGTVAAVAADVSEFAAGDAVYAYGFLNPKGGFYAEYAAVPAGQVAKIPARLDHDQAGALAVTGLTALRGLEALQLEPGQVVCVYGASGGVGHPAVQLGKAMGLKVVAVVSGDEGAALVRRAGADLVIDSRTDRIGGAIMMAFPHGTHGVLAAVNAPGLEETIGTVRPGGRVSYPHGVQPEPKAGHDVEVIGYDGYPDRAGFDRLSALIEKGPFGVFIAESFPLADAGKAHVALQNRRFGRTILKIG